MKSCRFITLFSLLLITACLMLSCSRSVNPDIERGSDYYFEEGHPELRVSALGLLNEEDEAVISVAADIVSSSLIFRDQNGANQASVEIEVRVVGVEGTDYSDTYTTTLTVENRQESYATSQDVVAFTRDMNVIPGTYEVYITAIDQSSENQTTRQTDTYIPDPDDNVINLTAVQLLGMNLDEPEKGYQPITTYDVSTVQDSIRFMVQVTNNRSEDPLTVQSRLMKYESDGSPARPMSYNDYTPSSLAYKGIDYSSYDVLDETRRILEQQGSVMIEYRFGLPEEGNYRFQVTTEGDSEDLFRARDFSIKGENFPAIKTPEELAGPLVYLMGSNEHEELMEIEDPVELKEAIDRFWLQNVGSRNQARHVISLYYERVEEANKQFTNFKEGWKTDMGMMYILFGPPWYVDRRLNRMQWSYSYDRTDPRYNFFFERPRGRNEFFPFNNYLLQRNQGYFNIQYQQIQRWVSGTILNSRL